MSILTTADLHLDLNPRNADRWNLFTWLRTMATKYGVKSLLLLGDITDAKDRHESVLVNRFVNEIKTLTTLLEVVIVRGNHDCIDENSPFFQFLHLMDKVTYINKPYEFAIERNVGAVFLPNTRNWREDWQSLDHLSEVLGGDINSCKYIFCHQTFDGCLAENGTKLRGIPPSFFADFPGEVYSGDIHRQQKLGRNIEYVGSPYRVHFGDVFEPRVLLLRPGKTNLDLHYPGKGRELAEVGNLQELEHKDFEMGTQVKIRVNLKRTDYPDWPTLKNQIKALANKRGWELCGLELKQLAVADKQLPEDTAGALTPEDILRQYALVKSLKRDMVKSGLDFLNEAQA